MSESGKVHFVLAVQLGCKSFPFHTGKQGAYTIYGCEFSVHASKKSEGAGSNKVDIDAYVLGTLYLCPAII